MPTTDLTGMPPIEHLPFRFGPIWSDKQGIRLHFYCEPLDSREYKISEEYAKFVISNCVCAHCGLTILRMDDHVHRKKGRFEFADVELLIPESLSREFHKKFQRELLRKKQHQRALRIREGGGTHSASQITELLALQEEHCFYCYEPLISTSGKRFFHRDHFVPLEKNGSNDISNIVLCCEFCNLQKGVQDPEIFILWMLKITAKENRPHVMRIQKTVRAKMCTSV